MSWVATFTKKAGKAVKDLPTTIQDRLARLLKDIETGGPVRGNWPHYGKLADGTHHCHLKGGHPTYVACWSEQKPNTVEVYYVGTHEKAPY